MRPLAVHGYAGILRHPVSIFVLRRNDGSVAFKKRGRLADFVAITVAHEACLTGPSRNMQLRHFSRDL